MIQLTGVLTCPCPGLYNATTLKFLMNYVRKSRMYFILCGKDNEVLEQRTKCNMPLVDSGVLLKKNPLVEVGSCSRKENKVKLGQVVEEQSSCSHSPVEGKMGCSQPVVDKAPLMEVEGSRLRRRAAEEVVEGRWKLR
ncbi:UNVERIFIED_CONTAM: hypothetical protein Sindi_0785300 [Sesamum indicum]